MTNTDTSWTDRLASVMPTNFMNNISAAFKDNTASMFLDTMMNRIGLTVVSGVDSPVNPFSKYTGQVLDYGDTVQKYKIDFIKGQKYDPDNTNPFTTTKNKPYAQYITLDDSIQYHDRINEYEFKKAFTSDNKLGDFVSAKLDALYESDGLDKYTKWKKYLSDKDKYKYNVELEQSAADSDVLAGGLWDTFRLFANSKFRQPNSAYNLAGQTAISPSVDIIMRADDKLKVDNYLKGVYNLEKTDVNANIMLIDDFATVTSPPTAKDELIALILDSRALTYYPRTPVSGSIYNPAGNNMEYYLTIQGTYCIDKFRNAVAVYAKAAS